MAKSPDAFRTISEVADWLGIQAHVLRFWESKFTQVKPIKRAGGRRYYRPSDMQLLGGIKRLLHDDGLTIKGVQKVLREDGMSHVAALSPPLDEATQAQVDQVAATPVPPAPETAAQKGVVLSFETPTAEPQTGAATETDSAETDMHFAQDAAAATAEPDDRAPLSDTPEKAEPEVDDDPAPDALPAFQRSPAFDATPTEAPGDMEPLADATAEDVTHSSADVAEASEAEPEVARELARPETQAAGAKAAAETPPQRRPRIVPFTGFASEADIDAAPATLSAVYRLHGLNRAAVDEITPLLARLTTLRDRMASSRGSGPDNPDAKA